MPTDAYLIRDAIVGNPTDDEKQRAVGALGELIAAAPPTGDPERCRHLASLLPAGGSVVRLR